jgi:hypothetical protein
MRLFPTIVLAVAIFAAPASAKWIETPAAIQATAAGSLSVTPPAGWNRWSKKPQKRGELWSLDGPMLNRLEFFGGVRQGEPLAKERNKKREPLPKFMSDMKASDVADLIEQTIRNSEGSVDFTLETVEPAQFAGSPGFRLSYRYTIDELTRRAEAQGAIIDGKLYMIAFTAPAVYYFDAGLPRARAVIDSAKVI